MYTPHLLSPLATRHSPLATSDGSVLDNRVVMAPMTRARAGKSRIPTQATATYYAQRAYAGLIITEVIVVSEQRIGWLESPGIYDDTHSTTLQKRTYGAHKWWELTKNPLSFRRRTWNRLT
jgi:2,4-dienoyl-CoA reductase-like NADH-dependent reductase (Old Yellow Enzyme family)